MVYPHDQQPTNTTPTTFLRDVRQMHPKLFSGEQQYAVEFLLWVLGNLEDLADTFRFEIGTTHKCPLIFALVRTDKDTTFRLSAVESPSAHSASLIELMPQYAGRNEYCSECKKQFLEWFFAEHSKIPLVQLPRFTHGATNHPPDSREIFLPSCISTQGCCVPPRQQL